MMDDKETMAKITELLGMDETAINAMDLIHMIEQLENFPLKSMGWGVARLKECGHWVATIQGRGIDGQSSTGSSFFHLKTQEDAMIRMDQLREVFKDSMKRRGIGYTDMHEVSNN